MKNKESFTIREKMPFNIQIKYNYLIIDNEYKSVITVVKYDKIIFLDTINALLADLDVQISFIVKRQSEIEFVKKLSSVISTSGAEIKSANRNQIDNEILLSNKKEAESVKKKIQIDNEQIYLVETYIKVSAKSEKEINFKVKNIIDKLYVAQILARPCNFRQKEAYIASLPIKVEVPMLSKYTETIFTSNSFAMLFPFFTNSVCNLNGTLLGKANNNICKIDLLSDININYNMCVFGSSGAGKSYFIKLHLLRTLYKGINQIIIDPEGEYVELLKSLGANIYTVDTYNPLYIDESFAKSNNNFFKQKIEMVCKYIKNRFNYNIGNEEEKIIKRLYGKYGINEKIDSLYEKSSNEKIYIVKKYKADFPTLKELLKELSIENLNINDNTFNPTTKLHCFYIKSKTIEGIRKEMQLFLPKIYELIEFNTLIYFDEIWKCISMGKDKTILEDIYNMFKTLRKKKTGIIAISQDIGDLFSLDNGNLGMSILNNSHTKVFFKLEYSDVEKLSNLSLTEELVKNKVFGLERGCAYVKQGNAFFKLEVIASEYENKLIEGEKIV